MAANGIKRLVVAIAAGMLLLTGCSTSEDSMASYTCEQEWNVGPKAVSWQEVAIATIPPSLGKKDVYETSHLDAWRHRLAEANRYAGPATGMIPGDGTVKVPVLCPAEPDPTSTS